jgi:hypothetical protein
MPRQSRNQDFHAGLADCDPINGKARSKTEPLAGRAKAAMSSPRMPRKIRIPQGAFKQVQSLALTHPLRDRKTALNKHPYG